MQNKRWWITGYLIALALTVIAPLASSAPDGLESVAEQQGYVETAKEPPFSIIPDYLLPGVNNEAVATILAGMLGVTILFVLVGGLAYLTHKRHADRLAS